MASTHQENNRPLYKRVKFVKSLPQQILDRKHYGALASVRKAKANRKTTCAALPIMGGVNLFMRYQIRCLLSILRKPVLNMSQVIDEVGACKRLLRGEKVLYKSYVDAGRITCIVLDLGKMIRRSANIGELRSNIRSKAVSTKRFLLLVKPRDAGRTIKRSFSRSARAPLEIIGRISKRTQLDKIIWECQADPGYQLFFPEVFLVDRKNRFKIAEIYWGYNFENIDVESLGKIVRIGTFAERYDDLATLPLHFFKRYGRFRESRPCRDSLIKEYAQDYWDIVLRYVRDPRKNPDVKCLFITRWPLWNVTGDWKLDKEYYDWFAFKPLDRSGARGQLIS